MKTKDRIHISAEIGTSHNGSLEKAKELISAAAEAGADSVKFQWVYAEEILHPNTGLVSLPTGNIPLYDRFRQLEVSSRFFSEAKNYAHKVGCEFICSPFGLKSLQELVDISPDRIKIASPELNHYPLLKKLTELRKQKDIDIPVILSSGVSTLADIEKALKILRNTDADTDITLLHCVTSYPAPETEYNLRLLPSLSRIFNIPIGVSDHSLSPILVPILGLVSGATFIEKHITLSKKTDGLDDPVALEPQSFTQMVNSLRQTEDFLRRNSLENHKDFHESCYDESATREIIREMEKEYGSETIQKILGTGEKKLAPAEEQNYGRTNRSIHVLRSMEAGDRITPDSVAILRTEKILEPGLSPEFFDVIVGSILRKNIDAGQGLTWQYLLSFTK